MCVILNIQEYRGDEILKTDATTLTLIFFSLSEIAKLDDLQLNTCSKLVDQPLPFVINQSI